MTKKRPAIVTLFKNQKGASEMILSKLSIKWKILILTILGPVIIAILLAWQQVNDIRSGAEKAIITKSAGIVLMAEAARNEMAKNLQAGIVKPFDQLTADNILRAVPVVMAMNVAASKAKEAGYVFRVPKVDPRNPSNTPDNVEKSILDEITRDNLSEKIIIEDNQIRYFRPIRLTAECLYCHGDPRGEKDVTGGIKEGWHEGEIHGAFEIISSLEDANKAVDKARWSILISVSAILSIVILGSMYMLQTYIIKPLRTVNGFIDKIANGDLSGTLKATSGDEIGNMIRKLSETTTKLNAMIKGIVQAGDKLFDSAGELSTAADSASVSSTDTASRTISVAAAAEEMSTNMSSVAAATEQATTNIAMVSSATSEMTSTINQIVHSTENAQKITKIAVLEASSASEKVDELGQAADEIGRVTEAITKISEQTNLLALNATIEATRAGETGKGFAVVANEIKELARQTAGATRDIQSRIESIQGSTEATVKQIQKITQVINDVDNIVNSIVTAVAEQSSTTNEIATNISEATIGIQEVTINVAQASLVSTTVAHDIAEISLSTNSISQGSSKIKNNASNLTLMAEQLKDLVRHFKI